MVAACRNYNEDTDEEDDDEGSEEEESEDEEDEEEEESEHRVLGHSCEWWQKSSLWCGIQVSVGCNGGVLGLLGWE